MSAGGKALRPHNAGAWDLSALLTAADATASLPERHLWLVRLLEWMRRAPLSNAADRQAAAEGAPASTPMPVLRLRHLLNVLDRNDDHRARVGGSDVKLFFNIVPESAKYLADRDLTSITETTVFATLPDAICVSGLTAGAPTDLQSLAVVKGAAGEVPVFVNTGVRAHNVAEQLAIADGAIVGTYFKEGGVFENRTSRARVEELMSAARQFRASAAG